MGAFLKAKDETISALQQQLKTSKNNQLTQEATRNYKDTGRSRFHFHPNDVGDMLGTYVLLSSRTSVILRTISTSRSSTLLQPKRKTCPDRFPWLSSFLNRCEIRYLLATSAKTMSPPFPESCLPETLCITRKSRRRKTNILVKLHKDIGPVLEVLLHTAIQTLGSLDDTVSTGTLLSEC